MADVDPALVGRGVGHAALCAVVAVGLAVRPWTLPASWRCSIYTAELDGHRGPPPRADARHHGGLGAPLRIRYVAADAEQEPALARHLIHIDTYRDL